MTAEITNSRQRALGTPEVLRRIFSSLSLKDLRACQKICRLWEQEVAHYLRDLFIPEGTMYSLQELKTIIQQVDLDQLFTLQLSLPRPKGIPLEPTLKLSFRVQQLPIQLPERPPLIIRAVLNEIAAPPSIYTSFGNSADGGGTYHA